MKEKWQYRKSTILTIVVVTFLFSSFLAYNFIVK